MRFDGEWLQCDDGIIRPVIRADIAAADGSWRAFELLVDTGADRTVISANVLESLNLAATNPNEQIGGVGGLVESIVIETQIRMTRSDGQQATFRGEYAACLHHESLDMSVLGRDILDLFSLIVDRQSGVIALIGGHHTYTIQNR